MSASAVALIPARSGSLRVPAKNVRELAGHPLLAYSIAAARESGLFAAILVSTDSEEIAEVARRYGAEVPGLRPAELAGPTSPDVEWVTLAMAGRAEEIFAILRPTSPFRSAETITARLRRASSSSATGPTRSGPSSSSGSIPARCGSWRAT